MTAHWGVEDPAAVEGSDTEKWLAFRTAFRELENRIKVFTALPIRSLDRAKLQAHLHEIGSSSAQRSRLSHATRAGSRNFSARCC